MATHVLRREDRYPVGTSVTARLRSNWLTHELPPTGDPKGSAAATATVQADGSVTFTGLADATNYFAHADISGDDRYVSFRTPVAPATTGAATYATSLPGSPADGDLVHYEVDGTNGVVWAVRWKASLSKWVFLGGPSLVHEIQTSETTASTSYANLATVGPTLTLPVAGLYELHWGANIAGTSAAGANYSMALEIAGAAAGDNEGIVCVPAVANQYQVPSRLVRRAVATPFTVVAKYRASAGTGTYVRRWLSIRPVTLG